MISEFVVEITVTDSQTLNGWDWVRYLIERAHW